ncbi:MAG: acetolactate decarboxylase [Pseudomonadota bacterium]
MSHPLKCRISDSLWTALQREQERTGDSLSHIVQQALAEALDLQHHSLFQVSTIGAVVKGVFDGCTSVGDLKRHGDFGLGTFDNLDGELIMLDGHCYRAVAEGVTSEVDDDWSVPFATVTRFTADQTASIEDIASLEQLLERLDAIRPSQNLFVGLRIEGLFDRIDMRAAYKAKPGVDLVEATSNQSEYGFDSIEGTLVGMWTPEYAKAIGVPGYHLHFLSSDRTKGGHVLGLKAARLAVSMHLETDIHIGIPETHAFLEADLQDDPDAALDVAEKGFVRDR